MIDPKEVTASKAFRPARHFLDRHATDGGSGDERAYARTGVHTRFYSALVERAQNADMREAFHAAATEYECDALAAATTSRFAHRQNYCRNLYNPYSPTTAPPIMKTSPALPPTIAPTRMAAPPTIIIASD